jgi:hypothetical protein
MLPWLANGRLAGPEREVAEEHVRHCDECERELRVQRLMCDALTEPERVTYAPGPSFRKLMERIDKDADSRVVAISKKTSPRASAAAGRKWTGKLGAVSLWRPPGLAWAASFLLLFGITGMLATAYHWSQPTYSTHTSPPAPTPDVLHIALDRSLPIGDVEELLRTSGARIVEGPSNTGVFGVTPAGVTPGQTPEVSAKHQLRSLSERLRSDSRVLWVQPLEDVSSAAQERAPGAQEH